VRFEKKAWKNTNTALVSPLPLKMP